MGGPSPGGRRKFLSTVAGGQHPAADSWFNVVTVAGAFMQRLAIVIGCLATAAGTCAFAADMAVKAPPVAASPAAVASWEGFYVGGDIGYGIGISKLNVPGAFDSNFFGSHGVSGGVLGGYNHMLAPRWLLGIEADANWSSIDHSEVFNDGFGDVANIAITEKHSYSVRGRLGYLLAPNTLLYGTGGWSWAQFVYSLTSTVGAAGTATLRLGGPQLGFGVETQLGRGWNARLEYLEAFYGDSSFNSSVFGTNLHLQPAVGVGRLALIYRFGADKDPAWAAPAPTPSWNGPTIAATVAAVTATAKVDSAQAPGNDIDGFGSSAILPTALVGYNWRIAPRWVFGIDGGAAPGIATTQIHIDGTEAAHARLGYLLTPATMIYASTGWFQSGFNTAQLFANKALAPHQRANALEIGAGVETALDGHWAVRFEYQYGFIQTIDNVVITVQTVTGPTQLPIALHPQVQSAQAGLVYRFNN